MSALRPAVIALVMLGVLGLGGLVSSADEGTRIKVTQIDVGTFPDIRIVASVTDAAGRAVRGLTAADLTVSEGGVLQNASIDLASEASPVAIPRPRHQRQHGRSTAGRRQGRDGLAHSGTVSH